jgi:hypothetical protein
MIVLLLFEPCIYLICRLLFCTFTFFHCVFCTSFTASDYRSTLVLSHFSCSQRALNYLVFHFFLLWEFQIKVILETRRVHLIQYLRYYFDIYVIILISTLLFWYLRYYVDIYVIILISTLLFWYLRYYFDIYVIIFISTLLLWYMCFVLMCNKWIVYGFCHLITDCDQCRSRWTIVVCNYTYGCHTK